MGGVRGHAHRRDEGRRSSGVAAHDEELTHSNVPAGVLHHLRFPEGTDGHTRPHRIPPSNIVSPPYVSILRHDRLGCYRGQDTLWRCTIKVIRVFQCHKRGLHVGRVRDVEVRILPCARHGQILHSAAQHADGEDAKWHFLPVVPVRAGHCRYGLRHDHAPLRGAQGGRSAQADCQERDERFHEIHFRRLSAYPVFRLRQFHLAVADEPLRKAQEPYEDADDGVWKSGGPQHHADFHHSPVR
mmetsp:Transcript_46729/g.130165  ORF Transcript_46729/g.130165 Transcript_46729/m.130165 type:complete len:242 (+) Transcript_46729:888-1613(+)